MSLIFAMVVDKQMPDKYDVIGAIICIVGVLYVATQQSSNTCG